MVSMNGRGPGGRPAPSSRNARSDTSRNQVDNRTSHGMSMFAGSKKVPVSHLVALVLSVVVVIAIIVAVIVFVPFDMPPTS